MMFETKSDTVRRLVSGGKYSEALRIVKGFRLGIAKTDLDKIRRAHECMTNSGFYRSIGFNPDELIADGIETLKSLYAMEG